ncbi:PAS domain S-box protein [uncultured Zobellia sp.]|uniref:PAS domain-containing sensor histidine kinase n=1 Tax=uncultured Zobellia sp. TaxID=255433 RepID=UPI002599EC55|nr:PAS domain S-box protein [uncultured Zobellia sp.]
MKDHKNIIGPDNASSIRALLRIGTWKLNMGAGTYVLDNATYDILEIPYGTVLRRGENGPLDRPEKTSIQIENGLKNLIEAGIPFDYELEFTTPKGNTRWLHILAMRKLENGNCTEVVGILQDITKTKQRENKLFQQNQLLNLAVRKAKLGHWNWDLKTDTFTCSENMRRIIDFKGNEFVPFETVLNYIYPEDKEYVKDQLAINIKNKVFENFTHRLVTHDGEIRTIDVSGDIYFDSDNNITNILGISQDVTAYKKIELEVIKKNELLTLAEQKALLGHWQWNIKTDEVFWSANLYYLFKQEENSKLEFDTYFGYVHPEDQQDVTIHFNNAIEDKVFNKIIHRILLKDGTLKWILLLGEVILNEKNEIIKLVGTCQDVTEQQQQAIKFKGLVDSAPSATLIVGNGNVVHMINKQAENLFGFLPEELEGKSVELLFPPRLEKKRAPHRKKFLANPKVKKIDIGEDLYMVHKSGKEIPVEVTLGPLETDEGLLISMAIRDITAEKRYERKILKAKEELEILTEELTAQNLQLADFTQITSHNLRAPVSNLNSLVDIYKLVDNEEERKELFQKFETVIDHLTLTLNTLIEALSAKSNTAISRSDISFSKTLIKTQEILTAEITRTNAVITSDFTKADTIKYPKIYLESIFQNLIGNALKYKSQDRIPRIEITSELNNGNVILNFKDNGLGIDLNKHGHKIFGLNKVFHKHPEAKGIGLFMTKTQIEAMGGTISIASKVNEGTTFSIQF